MKKISVLGAGVMGAGIAQEAARAGYTVVLRDLQNSLVKDGLKSIKCGLERWEEQQLLSSNDKDEILGRITGTTDLTVAGDVDLVIEAVVENMAVKRQLFAELDNICPQHTVLMTNTSSLSISEIASSTHRQAKVMGMHFFYPVPSTRLVELVRGMATSDNTLQLAKEFCTKIGKQTVVVKRESPGFIVNRIMVPYLNEAIHVLGDGLASREEIDLAMKLGLGMTNGPLEIADSIGLDYLYSVILTFYNEFRDPKYRPHTLFSTMIKAGYLGKKSGHGFYDYV
ncbi:MAG: 3-hydroxybutyryl-CoA dehydrogenase [Syntrophomonadaceae bacterium]|nr:3-hydroxybutyryl-CoA dehydrogenase [Syntrophomonadaceae bacterium]